MSRRHESSDVEPSQALRSSDLRSDLERPELLAAVFRVAAFDLGAGFDDLDRCLEQRAHRSCCCTGEEDSRKGVRVLAILSERLPAKGEKKSACSGSLQNLDEHMLMRGPPPLPPFRARLLPLILSGLVSSRRLVSPFETLPSPASRCTLPLLHLAFIDVQKRTHMTLPYNPKNAESINANPRIGPAVPAKKNRRPSVRYSDMMPRGAFGCVDGVAFAVVVVDEVVGGGAE